MSHELKNINIVKVIGCCGLIFFQAGGGGGGGGEIEVCEVLIHCHMSLKKLINIVKVIGCCGLIFFFFW